MANGYGQHDAPARGGVFFACAYSPERVDALRGSIRSTVEGRGLRLDAPVFQPGGGGLWRLISSQIDASLIGFYDYREPNMNVAVEVGYALGRGKPVVVLTNKDAFPALPRPLAAVFSVMCPDDKSVVDALGDFLAKDWPPGHYDWRDLHPTTALFEPERPRTGSRLIVFGDDEDLCAELDGATVNGYAVDAVVPESETSPDGISRIASGADAALFVTRGKTPLSEAVASAGAAHLLAGMCLARGVPIRVLHLPDVLVASDLVGDAKEVTRDGVADAAADFVRNLAARPPLLSMRPSTDGSLPRRALLDRLSHHRTLFLWAEPGYGKSMLLSQLASPMAVWVTCSERTSSAQVLATVAREIARALPGAGSTALHHAQSVPLDEVLWRDALLADVDRAEAGSEVELVVDDAHHLAPEALEALSSITRSPQIRLLIAGRRPSGAGEAIAADPHVLRGEDLSFSLHECLELFAGQNVEENLLATLHDRTEGWPYALSLARDLFGLQGVTGLAAVSGGRREIATLFEESIFSGMSPEEREVVEAVALASTLTLDEAEWVVGRTDAPTTLASLARRPMFVEERGEPASTYRLHSLYRDFVLKRLRESRGPARLRHARRRLAEQFRVRGNDLAALRVAEEGEAWDLATDALRDLLPVADRLMARFLRERLSAFPQSTWDTDTELLHFAIQHDFDWGQIQEAERLTTVLQTVHPSDPFVRYFKVWAQLQRGALGHDDLPLLDQISEELIPLDPDAAGALRIARLELESRQGARPSPEELASSAEALAAMGSDEAYSSARRGEACLQAGWIYSRAFFAAYVANMTRLRTRTDVLGNVDATERAELAADALRWHSLSSELIARASSLLPMDEDPVARARYLQTAGVAQGNAALAVDRLGDGNTDPGLFATPVRLVEEAIQLWRGLRIERSELLALTEKAQLLYFASKVEEADSLIAEAARRATAAGWFEIVARCAAVRALRDLVVGWEHIPGIDELDEEGVDRFAASVMEDLDVPPSHEHFANVRAEIVRLRSIDREKRSHCRHIDLVEHRRGSSPTEFLGREICPCSVVCSLLRLRHPGGVGDVEEPIAAFKDLYCVRCPHKSPRAGQRL